MGAMNHGSQMFCLIFFCSIVVLSSQLQERLGKLMGMGHCGKYTVMTLLFVQ